MKLFLVLVLFVGINLTLGENVFLTEETFDETLKGASLSFVNFYDPSSDSKETKRIEKVWKIFYKSSGYELFTVDCISQQALCTAQEITSYPTVKVFNKNWERKDWRMEGPDVTQDTYVLCQLA